MEMDLDHSCLIWFSDMLRILNIVYLVQGKMTRNDDTACIVRGIFRDSVQGKENTRVEPR